jgi:glycosyltransferase involved in cell wall biosynthesis
MASLRICVDGRSLGSVGGVSVYTRSLLEAMDRKDRVNSYKVLISLKGAAPHFLTRFRTRRLLIPGRIANAVWRRLPLFPMNIGLGACDVFFSPNFTLPLLTARTKAVLTVHDLAFMKLDGIVTSSTRRFLEHWVPYSIRRADAIIAVSESTKRDIISQFGVPEGKIRTIPCACGPEFGPLESPEGGFRRIAVKYGLPKRFILYHGTLEPRKNLPVLLRAYAKAKARLDGVHLVCSGKKGWLYEGIFNEARELGLQGNIHFPGYIEEADLPLLFNSCLFFVFVSKYEGFGLPVLEAMKCGKAVIVSNVSSLPEVTGNAGVLVEADDPAALAEVMIRLVDDTAYRLGLEKASLLRSRDFSWEAAATETITVIESIAGAGMHADRD